MQIYQSGVYMKRTKDELNIRQLYYVLEIHIGLERQEAWRAISCDGQLSAASCISVVSCSGAVMRQTLSVDWIARRRQATTSHCCRVQRRVEIWVHRNIIVLATTAWVESLCQWGRVVVVVHCSAVECDYWGSQRPTRDLHCPVISDEAAWRQWMFSVDNQWRLLHSPTHTHTHTHAHTSTYTKYADLFSSGKYYSSIGNWEFHISICGRV